MSDFSSKVPDLHGTTRQEGSSQTEAAPGVRLMSAVSEMGHGRLSSKHEPPPPSGSHVDQAAKQATGDQAWECCAQHQSARYAEQADKTLVSDCEAGNKPAALSRNCNKLFAHAEGTAVQEDICSTVTGAGSARLSSGPLLTQPSQPRSALPRLKHLQQQSLALKRTGSQPLPSYCSTSIGRCTAPEADMSQGAPTAVRVAGLDGIGTSTPRGHLSHARHAGLERCRSVPAPPKPRRCPDTRKCNGSHGQLAESNASPSLREPRGRATQRGTIPRQTFTLQSPLQNLALSLVGVELC